MTQTISGGDIIVRALADEGVDTIFGYSGGAILPTYDSIFRFNEDCEKNGRRPIQLVVPACEQGAGFMAAGYARSTGKVGVFLVTSGPGATNSVTPIRDCMADSVPVVLITGQVPRAALGSDAFFPFRDGIEQAAEAGVTAIIQPGGSVRDQEVIAAANERGMTMVFTGRRLFRH